MDDTPAYVRKLRAEVADMRRQLGAYQALLLAPSPPPDPGPIATRWQDVRWRATMTRDGGYVVAAVLYDLTHGHPILDLDEPHPVEVAALELAAQAPADIRTLLATAEAYARLKRAVQQLLTEWQGRAGEPTRLDPELQQLAKQLQTERQADLARGVGDLFEEEGV